MGENIKVTTAGNVMGGDYAKDEGAGIGVRIPNRNYSWGVGQCAGVNFVCNSRRQKEDLMEMIDVVHSFIFQINIDV